MEPPTIARRRRAAAVRDSHSLAFRPVRPAAGASIILAVALPRPNHAERAEVPRAEGSAFAKTPHVARFLGIAIAAIATLVVVTADWDSPIRVALTFGFLLFGPGLALAELLEIDDPVQRLALATAASLAIETLVAVALLYSGLFRPDAAVAIVASLTCIALLVAMRRGWYGSVGAPATETRGVAT